jgi:hypothetical protein
VAIATVQTQALDIPVARVMDYNTFLFCVTSPFCKKGKDSSVFTKRKAKREHWKCKMEGNTKRARIPTNFFVQQNSKERELETLKKSADRPKKKVPSCISHVFLASELERRI